MFFKQSCTYKVAAGCQIEADVYRAPDRVVRPAILWLHGNEPEWFSAFCPIRNVTHEYPPTLLIHGDQDTDVPFEQSVLMSKELEHRGVAHELVTMPNRGHIFDIDGERMADPAISKLFNQVLDFLEKHGMQ